MSFKQMGSYEKGRVPTHIQEMLKKHEAEISLFTGDDSVGYRLHWIKKVNGFYERTDVIEGRNEEECFSKLIRALQE